MTGRFSFAALGTTATVLTTDASRLDDAVEAVRAVVAEIDQACSRFRPDSELMSLAPGAEQRVSRTLAAALRTALTAARSTGGVVDPTVGGTLIALGYDRDYDALDPDAAASQLPLHVPDRAVDWRSVGLDEHRSTVRIPAGVVVDVGATGKAFAADLAAHRAMAAAHCGVLVNLGGDIATAGRAPQAGWAVGIADSHRAGADAVQQTIAVTSGAVATSSVTTRTWRHDGREVHHIIDPATRAPADVVWRTVSVVAPSCAGANTVSTACLVHGERALGYLANWRLPARLVARDGRVVTVGGWPEAVAA